LDSWRSDGTHHKLTLTEYEATDPEELARDFGFHPVDETDAGQLAREGHLSAARDNGLVPNREKRRDDALGV
jgi:hypothetical protein